MSDRRRPADFSPEVLELYDQYVHGAIGRRTFLEQAGRFAVGGLTAAAILDALTPDYALAQQVPPDDPRLHTARVTYPSPRGHGSIRAYLVRPAEAAAGRLPGVVVVHENRGLNPYIEDVTRRLGVAGFLAFAPDGLTPAGGYPGNDDEGRALQAKLDRDKLVEDFLAAVEHLQAHPDSTGRVGIVGFCYGGFVANVAATRNPELAAAVPFYGRQPAAEDAAKIRAPLLLHFAEKDEGVNAGWPAWEAALKAAGVRYTADFYPGTLHGFHNDTTPRYDEAAAKLAWKRTVEFFETNLR